MPATPPDYRGDLLTGALAYLETAVEMGDAAFVYAGLREHGVPWSTASVVGHEPSRAECRACLRTAAALEEDGLIRQIAAGTTNRVTHIRLTDAGLREAIRLAEGQADPTAIAATLRRTTWGAGLVNALETTPKRRNPRNAKRTKNATGQTETDPIAAATAPNSIAGSPPANSTSPTP